MLESGWGHMLTSYFHVISLREAFPFGWIIKRQNEKCSALDLPDPRETALVLLVVVLGLCNPFYSRHVNRSSSLNTNERVAVLQSVV